jgi:carbon monoxide dehydrogenase subunit G
MVTFTARDAFGSQELTGGLPVALSVKGSATGSLGKPIDNHNGTYTALFTAGSIPGVDTFSATINKKAVKATASLTVVGPYSLAKSVVSVPKSSVALGTPITVTLTALDALGHQELTGGLKVVFSLAKGSAGGTFSKVTDNHNGTYTATFTGSKTGSDTITATINGKPVTSKPAKITVTAKGGVRLPAEAAASAGLSTVQDAALLALLAESNGGPAVAGTKKGLAVSGLWLLDEE